MSQSTEKLLEAILQKLQDGGLHPVSWAQELLGHQHECSTRRWLRRHDVRVIRGRLLESEFYRVWREADDLEAMVREALRS